MRKILLAAALAVVGGLTTAAATTSAPQLFAYTPSSSAVMRGGNRLYPVQWSRDLPQVAGRDGGFWIPMPDGRRIFARTQRVIEASDGNRTLIGKVDGAAGPSRVVVTIGPHAVFGDLGTLDGKPLLLLTSGGQAYVMVQNGIAAQRLETGRRDYRLAPSVTISASARAAAAAAVAANTGNSGATVDVLLAYTPGMVTRLGSVSAVVTRLNHLVALSNEAYANSQVGSRVRLVGSVEIDYPDNGDDGQVLDDLTNSSANGPLASLRRQRETLGADLVSVVRPFSLKGQNGVCGLGYVNGGNLSSITPASAPYGYSTVSDGSDPDSNYYCFDITLAHEMGHNMGLVHEQADASSPGAYPYAYGWRQTLPSGSFATIMAYPTGSQEMLRYFADPAINLCNGNACGDVTVANQTLALNQTMPVVAAFKTSGKPRVDVNADGQADVILQSDVGGAFTTMVEGDSFVPTSNRTQAVAAGYRIATIADLNGDRKSDLIWTSAARDLYFWINNGDGTYSAHQGPSYAAGWQLIGSGDLDADGSDDLLWINATTHQFQYWSMEGSTVASRKVIDIAAGYHIAAIGDLNADGRADLVWTSNARDLYYWIGQGSGGFISVRGTDYPAGWQLRGAGDINADGSDDLVWVNDATHQFAYWLMQGGTRIGYDIVPIAAGYRIAAIDRFLGGSASILWTTAARDLYLWKNNGQGNFTSSRVFAYPASPTSYNNNYPAGWSVISDLPLQP